MVRRSPRFKTWYWLIACLVCTLVSAFALRSNYQHMSELREAVHTADKQNGDVEGALQELRSYVGRHMNTDLSSGPNAIHPPIQLKYTYERLTRRQIGTGDETVYSRAQTYCEEANPQGFSGGNRVACIQDYVQRNGGNTAPQDGADIPKNLYQFDFASPRWSPDLAGWSLAGAVVFALAFVGHSLVRLFRKPPANTTTPR